MEWKWEPIETAPKDNLIVVTDGGCLWQGFWQNGRWITGYDDGVVTTVIRLNNITHWAPIPDSPNATKEEAKDA